MITIKHLKAKETSNGSDLPFYPITHESAVIDDNNITLEEKMSRYDVSKYYIKTTYEYNKEININSSNKYVELDYITSPSLAYIDTGYVPSKYFQTSMGIDITTLTTNDCAYMGCADTNSNFYVAADTYCYGYLCNLRSYRSSNSWESERYNNIINTKQKLELYPEYSCYYYFKHKPASGSYSSTYGWGTRENNIPYSSENVTYNGSNYTRYYITNFAATKPILIGYVNDKTYGQSYIHGAYIKELKFTQYGYVSTSSSDNILIHNYIPCINPNGVVGMFDTATSEFKTPAVGTYTAGPVKASSITLTNCVMLGRFSCSSSNVTIEINYSDSTNTYHCVSVLSTVSWSNNTLGTYKWNVYGDFDNSLTSKLFMKRLSNTTCALYLNTNEIKASIHVQCVNLIAEPQDVCEIIGVMPTDATIKPTNVNFNHINDYIRQNYLQLNYGGVVGGNKVSINSRGVAAYNNTELAADRLAIGSNGFAMSALDTNNDGAAIFMEKYSGSENNNLVIAMGDDGTAAGDDIIFRQYGSNGAVASNIYVPKKTEDTLAIYDDYYTFPYNDNTYETAEIDNSYSTSYYYTFGCYPNRTYFITAAHTGTCQFYPSFFCYNDDSIFYEWHFSYDVTDDYQLSLYKTSSSIKWDTEWSESIGYHYEIYVWGACSSIGNGSGYFYLYGTCLSWPRAQVTYSA